MVAESPPPDAESVTTVVGPPTDTALLEWLDSLPCEYQRFSTEEPGWVSDWIMHTYHGTGFTVPQDLTKTMQRYGYVFRQAAPRMIVFQRIDDKPITARRCAATGWTMTSRPGSS